MSAFQARLMPSLCRVDAVTVPDDDNEYRGNTTTRDGKVGPEMRRERSSRDVLIDEKKDS
jgi:hypothetical protein